MKRQAVEILVVEDDPGNAALIRRSFESSHSLFKLSFVSDLKTGRAALKHSPPDLALIDYLLPDGRGTELLPGLGIDPPLPIVIMTNSGNEEIVLQAMKAGAVDYLKKSVESIRDLPHFCERALRDWEHIIARRKTEQALRDSEVQFRAIFEQSSDSIFLVEPKTSRILAFNEKAHQNLGYTRKEFAGIRISDFNASESKADLKKHTEDILAKGEETYKTSHRTKDGRIRHIRVKIRVIKIKGKSFFLAILHDFTDERQAKEQKRLARSVFNHTSEAIMVVDADLNIVSVNPAFTEITGYAAHEVIGKNPRILKSGKHGPDFYKKMMESLMIQGHWEGEIWDRRKNGVIYPKWLSITAIKDSKGNIFQYIALFSDISTRKKNEQQLHFRAHYDPLTELPNRAYAFECLSQTINQGSRYDRKSALLFVDLDHFKQVNDTLGHDIGDVVLVKAADRLRSAVRQTDTVARTGGDEFLVLLPEITDREEVKVVAGKILDQMSRPFQVDGRDLFLGASIGITLIPDDGKEATTLLKNADRSMYQAKSSGRNNYQFFNKKMEALDHERTLLAWDLKQAVKNRELVVYYQTIVDLPSLETVSLEALVRWRHPRYGLIPPERFIPLAEQSSLISEISEWVLFTACSQLKRWSERYGITTALSVNLSSRDFVYGDLLKVLALVQEKSGLSPTCLTLEITEGLMIDSSKKTLDKLKAIKETGITLSVDDFGTGYSSLSYLSQYPIDVLKIDQSFIRKVTTDSQKKALVEAMVRMGQSLGMKVIAEGVETHEDLSCLVDLGCNEAQGYFFGKPLSAEAYEKVLQQEQVHSSE